MVILFFSHNESFFSKIYPNINIKSIYLKKITETYLSSGLTFARIHPNGGFGATNGRIEKLDGFIGKPARPIYNTFQEFPELLK